MAIVSGDMTSAKDLRELKVKSVGIEEWEYSIPAAERGAFIIMALKSGELIKMDMGNFMDLLAEGLDARNPEPDP